MHVTVFTKKLTEPEKQLFEEYLNKKLPKFEKYLKEFDEDGVKLNVTAEKFANKEAYKVEFVMEVPKAKHRALFASEDSHDLRKAVDFSQEKLIDQIKKALEKLHEEHLRPA